ncbi:SDR family oxidoreductase [Mesorhizobium sp. M00.F.Ca.ET.216.01.1.1]|uniref:SDR family oxidoreductase n=1 Tax=Mesorhizobium sp. M00.F.Ca.ET.216.01.1.1 TaxID=2500528 RepID=UPI000FDB28EB|nr:SDR family oxidoreductase [Mesorhizobium sp. M00.F.Ca.ET.216.01.1.1]TGQ35654.1 SDR family oxidoreductase [Mesorhizobium sp. M00.F.Ca.ET.216.01.1.1]
MRVFVTGASGFIGSAVVEELLGAGHEVIGLARSDAAPASLPAIGAEVHHGDLGDPESLRSGAAGADAVIHTAFNHDFSRFAENCELDRRAIETLGAALAGTDRLLVVTSAIGLLAGRDRVVSEDDLPPAETPNPRVATERTAAAVAARGGKVAVVRLPPSVHGDGDHGFVPILIRIARETGLSAYPSDRENRWPAVHRLDAARAFRLALEKGASGVRYHAVAESGVPFRRIAEVVARRLNVPLVALAPNEAKAHFGWFAHFAMLDCQASGERTEGALGWQPTRSGLLADIDREVYFRS